MDLLDRRKRKRVAPRCSSPSTHMKAPHVHPVLSQVLFPSDRESDRDSDSDEEDFPWAMNDVTMEDRTYIPSETPVAAPVATPVATPVPPPGESL
jgi:hypothetical protein